VSLFAIKLTIKVASSEYSRILPRSYIPRPKAEVVTHPAVVIVGQLNRGNARLWTMRAALDEIVAIHVDFGSADRENLHQQWQQL